MHHLDPLLLQAALEGDVPVKVLMRQLLAHMAELCPECAATVRQLRQALTQSEDAALAAVPSPRARVSSTPDTAARGGSAVPDPRYVGAFDRAQEDSAAWVSKVRHERRKAREDVRDLLRLPATARARRIERARSRYRSRAVADMLLEESRRLARERPSESRSLAGLVEVVVLWTPGAVGQDWARALRVRAAAWIANSYRVELDLRAAERAFSEVRARMAHEVVGEVVHAEVASLEASLRIEQGRFEEARRLLDQAAVFYRAEGRRSSLARVLIKRAVLEDALGDLAAAAAAQRQALGVLQGEDEPQLFRDSIVNLALFLVGDEKPEEAAEHLDRHAQVLAEGRMWDQPELQVIRGRIALAQDREPEAEKLFLAARAELIRRGENVRAAVASLDLAVLYLAQGKSADLRRMARLMGSILAGAELESEALAAVVLFQRAVEAESVTGAAIRAWRRQLEVGRPRRRKEPVS
jgi:tetratricopeptide (TPR) repeat protein